LEVTLTIGVAAIALPCLLGLLALALASQAEAEIETRATLIARSIFADLLQETGSHPGLAGEIGTTGEPAPAPDPVYPTLATVASAAELRLLYSADILPVRTLDEHSFEAGLASGFTASDAAALSFWMVRITLLRPVEIVDTPLAGTSRSAPSTCRIAISVEHPAGEPAHARRRVTFHTSVMPAELR
jgi:hypothetical protein